MADAFQFADELGPARVLHVYEPALGLRAIVVVDNVATGPAIGGVRMAEDASLDEGFRLARAMTLENAAAGTPHGGKGSAAAVVDPDGIDVAELIAIKDAGGQVRDYPKGRKAERDAVVDVECGIWIAAARPDVIRADTAPGLDDAERARILPRQAAMNLALRRVRSAMRYRRWYNRRRPRMGTAR